MIESALPVIYAQLQGMWDPVCGFESDQLHCPCGPHLTDPRCSASKPDCNRTSLLFYYGVLRLCESPTAVSERIQNRSAFRMAWSFDKEPRYPSRKRPFYHIVPRWPPAPQARQYQVVETPKVDHSRNASTTTIAVGHFTLRTPCSNEENTKLDSRMAQTTSTATVQTGRSDERRGAASHSS